MENPYQDAMSLAIDGHNIIITGQAGSGKSFLLNQIAAKLKGKGLTIQKNSFNWFSCFFDCSRRWCMYVT